MSPLPVGECFFPAGVEQPDVRNAEGLVFGQLLQNFAHLVAFGEDFDRQERWRLEYVDSGILQGDAEIRDTAPAVRDGSYALRRPREQKRGGSA